MFLCRLVNIGMCPSTLFDMLLNFVIQKTCMSKSQLFANGGIIKNDKSMTDHVLLNDYNKVETWIALWEEIRD